MNLHRQSSATDIIRRRTSSVASTVMPRGCGASPNDADAVGPQANDPLAVRIKKSRRNPLSLPPPWPPLLNKTRTKMQIMKTAPLKDKAPKNISTQFAFPAPTAQQVSLAGDFNHWDPNAMPMHKGSDGVWHLNVSLKPGRHEYRFIADGVWQDDPAARQKIANVLGTENCVRTVAG